MTGPDHWGDNGARTRNRVAENFGTTVQAGQAHGDINVGTSRTTTISLPAVSVIIGAVLTLVIGLAVWKFTEAESSPGAAPTHGSTPNSSPEPDRSTRTSAPAVASAAREVRLQRNTGVDVDRSDAKVQRADGLSVQIDLHLNGYNLLSAGADMSNAEMPQNGASETFSEEHVTALEMWELVWGEAERHGGP